MEKADVKEVDTVISTHEVLDLLSKIPKQQEEEQKFDMDKAKLEENEKFLWEISTLLENQGILENQGNQLGGNKKDKLRYNSPQEGTSNSYLFYVMQYFLSRIIKKPLEIQVKKGKNSDLTVCYKFSIENKMYFFLSGIYNQRKRRKELYFRETLWPSKYTKFYPEYKKVPLSLSLCGDDGLPWGCLNGGGQIKVKELKNKELIEKLSSLLHDTTTKTLINSLENPEIPLISNYYKNQELLEVFGTVFKAVERYENLTW